VYVWLDKSAFVRAADATALRSRPKVAKKSEKLIMARIWLGTSSFTAAGWEGAFYPARMQPRDFLRYYATRFDTVEVDSTYYHAPSAPVVTGWANKTPPGFLLAAKVPQTITHEKCLVDCEAELKTFLETMRILGDKLGPLLLQFPYFDQSVFPSGADFLSRLKFFLANLSTEFRFAIEIRNKGWLTAEFFDLLRAHHIAYALTDQSWMPGPNEIFEQFDPITADFTYIRWLGDRKGIERVTKVWNRIVVDRTAEMTNWVDVCKKIQRRGVTIFGYFNNHYAGFGPESVRLFRETGAANGLEIPVVQPPPPANPTLF
jgi:uncharacterized protein YecE (DUF72 family)